MQRRILCGILIGLIAVSFLGMSGLSASEDKFPKPKLDYKAQIIDQDMVRHDVSKISVDGKTALPGYRGKAFLSIDFRRIKQIDFVAGSEKTFVLAKIKLRNGKDTELKVKGLLRCHGMTELGPMSVRARDIRTVVFDDDLPKPEEKKGN